MQAKGYSMYGNDTEAAEILLRVAEAVWQKEAAKALDCELSNASVGQLSEAKGREGTLLRIAYEARERAIAEFERIRSIGTA